MPQTYSTLVALKLTFENSWFPAFWIPITTTCSVRVHKRPQFSNVLDVVVLFSKCARTLTFTKFPSCVTRHVLQGLTISFVFYNKEEACVDTLFVFQDKT